jgi:hypothetical protein
MRMPMLRALVVSAALGAGAAYADNPNVPSSSPYAVMAPGVAYPAAPPAYGWAPVRVYRHYPGPYQGRAAYREPNYVHDTAPPPGLMSDQPTTIGGYPLGY